MKKLKKLPKFKNENEERKFWASHDSADYFDWDKAEVAILHNLKPSTKTISLRLPEHLLYRIKTEANERDIPYQSYIKVLLAQGMNMGAKK